MPKSSPRKSHPAAKMEDGLTATQRLQQWGAAAELLYAPNSPINQPPLPKEPHTFLVARRIATVMARLNDLCQRESEVLLTPRDALLELADIIRFGLVSFHKEVVTGKLDRAEVASVLAEYVAHRKAPQAGIVEGLHVLAWVSVKLRVEMFLEQLRMRLKQELEGSHNDKRTAQQVAALRTTRTLLNDFESFYDNLLVTFPCVQLMEITPEAAEQMMLILSRQYYQLADWVALVEVNTTQTPITETKVQSVDREASTVVLRRTDSASPWGLIFNHCGQIVDIDTSLRSASEEGEELHRLLCCTAEGARVVAINSKTLPTVSPGGAEEVLEIFKNTTKTNKRIVLQLADDALKQARMRQLAFLVPNQGGEGSSGQRATLVLHRPDRSMPWECNFTDGLIVRSVPRQGISMKARSFFADYRGRVGLMAVNGVEVTTPAQAEALCAHTETVVLNFVVVTPAMAARSRAPMPERLAVALSQEQLEQVKETPLVSGESVRRPGERARKVKSQQQDAHENAEDLDAKADDACTADANEAEELAAEPEQHAEEDDVKETYPMVADEDAALDDTLGTEGRPQKNLKEASKGPLAKGDTPAPLVLPNNVTIELLTPEEMVIRRDSNEGQWGLSLESSGEGVERAMRITSLPKLASARDARRRHPFYQTFLKPPVKTEWRIKSVNGVSSLRAPDLLDIMRRSLKMRIKFFKG
ncbi:uncharacterized protein Tco025E_03447 [Trypanosoma conorhini]|uniref:Uncharacterized protein n=1 Tax=Trypanosoma conorhini TaxID=83891 RepID=A0A422PU68_9TRYP|nr:uncharacterized protein Tco025E_03447 [Trypanosoma conorhini]RNF21264.1 hypothetical protein Tco025E_03447 [Trypanosoma conorhini]